MSKINMDRKVSDKLTLGEVVRFWDVFDSMRIGVSHYDGTPVKAEEFLTLIERIKALASVNNVNL